MRTHVLRFTLTNEYRPGLLFDEDGRRHDLDYVMGFDTTVRVRIVDGQTFVDEDLPGLTAPELTAASDEDGQHLPETDEDLQRQARDSGWDGLLTGFTGQYGYHGPCMHAAEYVGGRLAEHILTTPGLYAATAIAEVDGEISGWAIAYKEDK